ncbi:O-antigen ligase family protein [Edwardsiella tarda]|uniref:O-antigen ligase family protein n=1 Tax=Edwardsiella tarda TaxID=636 RepID=UPI00351BFA0C
MMSSNSRVYSLTFWIYVWCAITLFVNPLLEAPKNIAMVLMLVFFIINVVKNNTLNKYGRWDLFFLLFVASYFIGLPFASHLTKVNAITDIVRYMLFGWVIYRMNFPERERLGLVFWATLGTVIGLIYGAYSHYILLQGQYWTLNSVGHVNHAAIYDAIITCMALSTLLAYWATFTFTQRAIWVMMLLICLSYIVLGESRATFGAVLVSMILLGVCHMRRNKKVIIAIAGITALIISISIAGGVRVVVKQEGYETSNNILSYRDVIWRAGLDSVKQHPWFGVGKDNFRDVKIYGRGFTDNHHASHAHNIYINTLTEGGVWGLFWQMVLFVSVAWTLLRFFPKKTSSSAHWANWGWCVSALSITLIVGLVNTTFHHEHANLAIFGFALWLSFYQGLKKHTK